MEELNSKMTKMSLKRKRVHFNEDVDSLCRDTKKVCLERKEEWAIVKRLVLKDELERFFDKKRKKNNNTTI